MSHLTELHDEPVVGSVVGRVDCGVFTADTGDRGVRGTERHGRDRTVTAGHVDLTTSTGRMHARIGASVAQHEVEHKAERQRAANQQHAEMGMWRSRKPVFGYERGGQAVVPAQADAIRQAARDILAGTPTAEIARRWNTAGLTTAQGHEWDSKKVVLVLQNPCFSQQVKHQGKVLHGVVGKWPGILDFDEHQALLAFFETRKTKTAKPRKWQGSGVYLCGKCNNGQVLMAASGADKVKFYRCPVTQHLGRKATDLDNHVNEFVVHRLSRRDAWDLMARKDNVDLKALRAEREGLQARKNHLAVMFAQEEIDDAQLRTGTSLLNPKIEALNERINAAGKRNPITEVLNSGDVREYYSGLTPDRRAIIIDTLMTVTVLPCPLGRRGFQPDYINIAWKEDSE